MKMKILLVGEIGPGGAVPLIHKNLLRLGVETELINTHENFAVSFWNRVLNKFLQTSCYFGSGIKKLNNLTAEKARIGEFNVVLFIKPIFFYPKTIKEIKKYAKIVSWYPDYVDFPKSSSS